MKRSTYLRLGKLVVRLTSDSQHLLLRWKEIFGPWALETPPQGAVEDLTLNLALVDSLPELPAFSPAFVDAKQIVDVYHRQEEQTFILHFHAGALVRMELSSPGPVVRGSVTPGVFQNGRLEDVTFTSLAPLLRRHDHFLVHAAAAAEETATLFVGPSGSGKTTTGLALMLSGWRYLANDVVLLARGNDGVYAFPTPSEVAVRSKTFTLLPELKTLTGNAREPSGLGSGRALQLEAATWAEASRVTVVCYPRLGASGSSSLRRLPVAVALARLMEESVDRWDSQTLDAHLNLLADLGRQCRHYELELGPDVRELPRLIADA